MILAHFSDLHYCGKLLDIVDRAFSFAIDHAIESGADAAIISGDSFDAAVNLHEPAVDAYFRQVKRLADAMPVAVLQGTFSHDRPGSLTPLRHIAGKHPVAVLDRLCQAAWTGREWAISAVWAFDEVPVDTKLLISALPSINKGAIAAAVGADKAASAAGELVHDICKGWAPTNMRARESGVATVLTAHGTVNGCVTETAHAMVSQDTEFSEGSLFAAEAAAAMVGHIHAFQFWERNRRKIAYPGSITKMIYGHKAETGYLLWDVRPDGADFQHVATPSRKRLELTYPGPPDMDDLERAAADCADAYVRIRYSVDEEYRASVDKAAIAALFAEAAEVKIEGRVNPVQRVRAAGISQAKSLAEQLGQWCEVTETDRGPLLERLDVLTTKDHREIIGGVVG